MWSVRALSLSKGKINSLLEVRFDKLSERSLRMPRALSLSKDINSYAEPTPRIGMWSVRALSLSKGKINLLLEVRFDKLSDRRLRRLSKRSAVSRPQPVEGQAPRIGMWSVRALSLSKGKINSLLEVRFDKLSERKSPNAFAP